MDLLAIFTDERFIVMQVVVCVKQFKSKVKIFHALKKSLNCHNWGCCCLFILPPNSFLSIKNLWPRCTTDQQNEFYLFQTRAWLLQVSIDSDSYRENFITLITFFRFCCRTELDTQSGAADVTITIVILTDIWTSLWTFFPISIHWYISIDQFTLSKWWL